MKKGLDIADLRSVMLVSTFFFLWLAVYFNQAVEEALAFILIFSFGILHGANDLEILRKNRPDGKRQRSNHKLLLAYVGFVLASALLFYVIPAGALLFFILFSSYHFGEQHWVRRMGKSRLVQQALYISYGLTILLLLFKAHGPKVAEIMAEIGGFTIPPAVFGWGSALSFAIFLICLLANFYWAQLQRYFLREVFLLGVFFVVFHSASLLWAFAIYFVVWHSIPSLADQIRLLYGNLTVQNGVRYVKSSAVYWIAALATLALAFLYFRGNDFGFLPLFFSFLAAITFPHVLVITRLYKG